MAKPKKKTGLHKHVSSVLDGVRIPQGVHNWRPPEESALDQTGDSPEILTASISSVFEGLSVFATNSSPEPTGENTQGYEPDTNSIQTPDGTQTSQDSVTENVDDLWIEQGESTKRVVYYRVPLEEPPRRSLRGWIRQKLFGANE